MSPLGHGKLKLMIASPHVVTNRPPILLTYYYGFLAAKRPKIYNLPSFGRKNNWLSFNLPYTVYLPSYMISIYHPRDFNLPSNHNFNLPLISIYRPFKFTMRLNLVIASLFQFTTRFNSPRTTYHPEFTTKFNFASQISI